MDEFTARILEEDAERAEHPERFRIVRVCRECGTREVIVAPKAIVAEFVNWKGSSEFNGFCAKHGGDDVEEPE